MKSILNRKFRMFFAFAAFWLAVLPAVAGKWTYDSSNNYITHSDTAWVLNVTRSGTALTVTDVYSQQASTVLPLADTISGGYRITHIGDGAFRRGRMTGVTIPDSVKSIGELAFYSCESLKSLTIGAGVTSMGKGAFAECSELRSLTIKTGVTIIGEMAFLYCQNLTGDLVIPDSVKSIGQEAFLSCRGLKSVKISNSVKSIGEVAFAGCSGLQNLIIGTGVTSIGWGAFADCTDLTSVTIPDNVKSIGQQAFDGCSGLRSVIIGTGMTDIEHSVFACCRNLIDVTFNGSFPEYCGYDIYGDGNCWEYDEYTGTEGIIYIPVKVITYILPKNLDSWNRHVQNGPIENGQATWEGRPIRVKEDPTPSGSATLAVNASPAEGGSVTGGGSFKVGSKRQISATANTGWHFTQWSDGNTSNPRTVSVPEAGATYTATFVRNSYTVAYNGNGNTGGATVGSAHTYGTAKALTANGFTKTGHTFAGWAASTGGAVVHANSASVLNLTATHGATVTLYAKWTANIYTVMFNAQGGVVSPTSYAVSYGSRYGVMPVPEKEGWYFAGWWTGANGSGQQIKRSHTFSFLDDVTLYAYWTDTPPPPDSYLDEAEGVEGEALSVTSAFDGFVYDETGTVCGTLTLNAKAAVKVDKKTGLVNTNWTVTAKAILEKATVSFPSFKKTGSLDPLVITAKKGEVLAFDNLGADTFYGELSGGAVGAGSLYVAGARAAFGNKKDVAAQAQLNAVKGLYNVALVSDVESMLPAGYVTLSVGNQGKVKIAGKLEDGTKVSGNAKLLQGLNVDGWYAVALYRPLYSKKGFIGGLLWINLEDKLIRVDSDNGWFVDWVCRDVKRGEFERGLDVIGGLFVGAGIRVPSYMSVMSVELPDPAVGLDGEWIDEALPWKLAITNWKLPKSTPPKKSGKGSEVSYDYSADGMVNPSGATLKYTAKTGLFKGAFKMYFDGVDLKGKVIHRTAKVSYIGVMVPVDGVMVGLGSGTATVNRQKIGVPVYLEHE